MRLSAFSLAGLLVEAATAVSGIAQVTPRAPLDPAVLAAGRQLVQQLTFSEEADRRILERIGLDRAGPLLAAVMDKGFEARATPSEWTEMHRAIAGLIEIRVIRGELFAAAVLANIQAVYYRTDEEDYNAALEASRQALALQQKSGETKTLFLCWQNVGEDLIRLGRVDEGLDALIRLKELSTIP